MTEPTLKSISVAMTTYNGGEFLKKQLDSILNQTLKVDEIIVCDDGSTDSTIQYLEDYAKKVNLKYFLNESNLGFVYNFEKAISLCIGEYIILADQDDIWYPEKVEALVNAIGDNYLIHSDCDLIDEADTVFIKNFKGEIKTHREAEDFLFNNVVTGCTAMIHRELVAKVTPFPAGLSYHDWYLAIHAAYLGKITYLAKSLTGYRQHTLQDTGSGVNERGSIFKNCMNRLRGKEFGSIKSSKRQMQNLKASINDFSTDSVFHQKQMRMIQLLQDYIENFFHLDYGAFYSKNIVASNKPKFVRYLYQLKFSIG